MGYSRQEYWSGFPRPPPGDLPDAGIEPFSPVSPALQAKSLPDEQTGKLILAVVWGFMTKSGQGNGMHLFQE